MADLSFEVQHMDISEPGAEERFLEFSRHENLLVRIEALEKLFDFNSKAVVDRITEVLNNDDEEELVVVAALEWVEINEEQVFHPLATRLLDDESDMVRAYAAFALSQIGSVEDVPVLEKRLAAASDGDKTALLFSLALLGDAERYIDDYLDLLGSSDRFVRSSIANNVSDLAELVDPERLLPKLKAALRVESHPAVGPTLARAIEEIEDIA